MKIRQLNQIRSFLERSDFDGFTKKEASIRRITKDRYGRTLAEFFKDEINIQELIVEKGLGNIYQKYAHQCEWSKG